MARLSVCVRSREPRGESCETTAGRRAETDCKLAAFAGSNAFRKMTLAKMELRIQGGMEGAQLRGVLLRHQRARSEISLYLRKNFFRFSPFTILRFESLLRCRLTFRKPSKFGAQFMVRPLTVFRFVTTTSDSPYRLLPLHARHNGSSRLLFPALLQFRPQPRNLPSP